MKRIICFILALCLLLSLVAVVASATEATEETTTATEPVREPGQCGEDLYWTYKDGVLTVNGSGDMDDFSDEAPWAAHKQEITSVVLVGVQYIGANAFRNYDALKTVDFGSALYEIGANAFRSCDGLTSISLPSSFKIFGESSFMSCSGLKEIHCAGRFPSFRQNSMWDTYVTIYYPAEKPWSADTIRQLETAFQGRIEFLASDGTDLVPDETEESEPSEPETQPTEPEPEATEEVTTETTEPSVDTQDTPEQTQPETDNPEETGDEADDEDEDAKEEQQDEDPVKGVWIGLAIVGGVLSIALIGCLLFRPKGKYSRRRR